MPTPPTPSARRVALQASAAASALAALRVPLDVLVARGTRWVERLRAGPRAGIEPAAGAQGGVHGPSDVETSG